VAGDQAALERTVRNLLDNARRHASSRVVVNVRREGRRAVVTVDDDGRGVPDDELDAIFTRFHRLDAGRSRNHGGTGLGLAIVRGVARSHGGDATATRGQDGGLSVRMTLDAL
jgi:signal transduction histidine kinase